MMPPTRPMSRLEADDCGNDGDTPRGEPCNDLYEPVVVVDVEGSRGGSYGVFGSFCLPKNASSASCTPRANVALPSAVRCTWSDWNSIAFHCVQSCGGLGSAVTHRRIVSMSTINVYGRPASAVCTPAMN